MNDEPTPANRASVPAKKRREQGQAVIEYAVMLAMFCGVTLVIMILMSVFSEYAWRMVSLVSMDL